MSKPDLTPYTLLLDHLLGYTTSEDIVNHLQRESKLHNRTLIQLLLARPAYDDHTARKFLRLYEMMRNMLYDRWLNEFLDCPEHIAFDYILDHPELLSQGTYLVLHDVLIQHAANADSHAYLLSRQSLLLQAAALLTLRGDWDVVRLVFLHGLSLLAHPIAQTYFVSIAQEHPEAADQVTFVTSSIARCVEEGVEAFIEETDLAVLEVRIQHTQGNTHIDLLRQALHLTKNVQNEQWAALQLDLGTTLLQESLLDYSARNLDESIQALQAALDVFTHEFYPEQWAIIQNNLGIAYIERSHDEDITHVREKREHYLEAAIEASRLALWVYKRKMYPQEWARAKNNLGLAYRDRLLGSKAQNLQKAIILFRSALRVHTRKYHLQTWAVTQINLASTYWESRLYGDQVGNEEAAIKAYEKALLVQQRDLNPKQWAIAQLNLGNAYKERTSGDKDQNVEKAIQAYKKALRVFTYEQYPIEWAGTQYNLGNAYSDKAGENHSLYIEDRIEAYEQALVFYTDQREKFPFEWASTRLNLGNAYAKSRRGDRADNIEKAIKVTEEALEVFTRKKYPEQWGMAHLNLGNAYQIRHRENRHENIAKAIKAFQSALQVFPLKRYPTQRANVLHSLGRAYKSQAYGSDEERAFNLKRGIKAFRLALRVRKRKRYPEEWALTQNSLGSAYWELRLCENEADNVEAALTAFQAALEVYTRELHPEQWAMAQNNLGGAYRFRHRGNRPQNLEKAIEANRLAITVYTREQDMVSYRDTSYNLGDIYYDECRWGEARATYEEAYEALELLRAQAPREESRNRLARHNALLYARLIHCCLQLNDIEAAATYALAGKSRSLTELLAGNSQSLNELLAHDPALAAEWAPIQALRDEVENLLAFPSLSHIEQVATNPILSLRQEINRRIDTLFFHFPALAAVQPLPSLTLAQAQTLSSELGGVPLIEYTQYGGGWGTSGSSWGAFIITPTGVHFAPLATNLLNLLSNDLEAILNDTFWKHNDQLRDQSTALVRMYDLLMAPLQSHLPAAGPLVVAPTHALHLVPFQALLTSQGKYLSDEYALSFVPSLATAAVLQKQRTRPEFRDAEAEQPLLSIAYSDRAGRHPLPNVLTEAKAVRTYFPHVVELLEDDALLERVFTAIASQPFTVIHLGCHGRFDYESPLDSGLYLAHNQWLTINDIRLHLRLQGRPLVSLSACQTGHTRPERGDESNGLSWAFLAAGASAVVSSQWSVADEATRELFEAFYAIRQTSTGSDAQALQQAMQHLRQQPNYSRQPYFWAAFQVMGLPLSA